MMYLHSKAQETKLKQITTANFQIKEAPKPLNTEINPCGRHSEHTVPIIVITRLNETHNC